MNICIHTLLQEYECSLGSFGGLGCQLLRNVQQRVEKLAFVWSTVSQLFVLRILSACVVRVSNNFEE
jgi:hypothetical protein